MHATRWTLWATAVLAATTPPVGAQLQDSLSRVAAALARLELGSRVRARTLAGRELEGTLLLSPAGIMRLHTPDAPGFETVAPLQDVDSLWVRHSYTGLGALIGAALFAIPGAILADYCPGCDNPPTGHAVPGALVGATIGALLGGDDREHVASLVARGTVTGAD
jgi:hypothetical protein